MRRRLRAVFRKAALVAASLFASACAEEPVEPTGLSPELDVSVLYDINSDPDVVEVLLSAEAHTVEYLAGKPTAVWAYRDGARPGAEPSVPGPTLEVKRGDRVIVHFQNQLDDPSTLHWHGLRLPNAADGTPASQVPIAAGGSYVYEFEALDAGTFWYHPHIQADVAIERGLYGAVRVLEEGAPAVEVDADRTFVLDDVKLESDGRLSPTTDALDLMLGRQGNVLLVNGRADARLQARSRSRQRWRFVNAANGRYFNLQLAGHPFRVVGWDGGLLAEPYEAEQVLVAPGERYEVLVSFDDADVGESLVLETVHYDRGHDIPDPGPLPLFQVEVTRGAAGAEPASLPSTWGTWLPIPIGSSAAVREFVLQEDEGDSEHGPTFTINGAGFPHHEPIQAVENEIEIWSVQNDTEMDHPFHLHGMFFQAIDTDGVAPEHQGNKDTVNIPRASTVRLAVEYDALGTWMYHCHILEHAERGMMGALEVVGRAEAAGTAGDGLP